MVSKPFASLAHQVEENSKISADDWYVVPVVVGGVSMAILITALVVFKLIQKRRQAMSDPETRLSAAYRDGFLREDSGPKWRSESLKRSGRSNNSTNKDGTSETSFTDDKQQSRRLIGQEGTGSTGCNGSIGYGGMAKENMLWSPLTDSRRDSEVSRGCRSDSSRLNSPRESKIEIETRGEKSYPTIAERMIQSVDYGPEDGLGSRSEERGFIEKCYDEYKSKKDKLADDERGDSKALECVDKNEEEGRLGKLFFEIKYDHERFILSISIIKAQGLMIADSILGSCDPYVKLQLLPDKKLKVKTRLLRKNQNPVFEEQFDFYNMEPQQVKKVTLFFSVYSFDRFSRDYVIGEVRYHLADMVDIWVGPENDSGIRKDAEKDIDNDKDKNKNKEDVEGSGEIIENSDSGCKSFFFQVCQDLLPQSNKVGDQSKGEILLSLCFNPSNCQLIVTILKARNLPQTDAPETIEPYVKIYLKFDGQRLSKKQTSSKPSTSNPVFNETFTFQLPRTPSELSAMLAWNRCNPLVTSTPSSTLMTRKFNLPCRLQGQICRDNDAGHETSNRDGKSRSSLFRRFSICSSTLMDKPDNSDPLFIPKSPTFVKNSSPSKRPNHILDRFSLSIFLLDEEQETSMSDFIGRVELGSFTNQDQNGSSDLTNVLTASDHWRDIIANPKKHIAKWYHLTN